MSRGRALLAGGDAGGAERALSTALDLWRGDPYQDWPDAPFAEAERTRLAELPAGARGSARSAAGAGDAREVVGDLQGRSRDPLREDWWRLLVLALYRSGRAMRWPRSSAARRILADELGTILVRS